MTDSSALDLERESTTAPAERELPYVQVGGSAEVIGGAIVFLSRNRKRVAAVGAEAPVFVSAQDGTVQQSIPYRAVAAALTHDIIPMSQVVARYVNAGRLDELVALVESELPSDETETETETEEQGA